MRKNSVDILKEKIHSGRLTQSERVALCRNKNGRLKKDEFWPRLRGMTVLAWVFTKTGWTWAELKAVMGKHRERSGLVDRWRKGKTAPKWSSLEKLEKLKKPVPSIRELYELPLWPLLANYPRSARQCKRTIALYLRSERPNAPYQYPELFGLGERWYPYEPARRDDSDTMVVRADIYAFTTLVALVREAEAEYRDEVHCYHLANLYRMLPSLRASAFLYPVIPQFAAMIKLLHRRVPYTRKAIGVDWRVLEHQIKSDDYSPLTPLRPYRELGDRLEVDIDPIIYADMYRQASRGSTLELGRNLYAN